MRSQQDSAGGLRHLITLDGLTRDALTAILDRAESYRRLPGQPAYEGRELAGVTLANLFFEPSTRTRASFDLASRRLGAHVLNLDLHSSSRAKGESMLDTIYTLEAMNTDVFVIRDSEAGMPEFLIDHVAPHVSVISAGEAHVSHPTQGLLDVLTIRTHKRRFAGLKVAIVGDIKHSRVARSAHQALSHARHHGSAAGGAGSAAAGGGRISRRAALHPHRGRHRRRRCGDDAAHSKGAHGAKRVAGRCRLFPRFRLGRAAPEIGRAQRAGHASRAR